MKCNSKIPFSTTNPSNVSRHMNSMHKDLVEENQAAQTKIRRKWQKGTIDYHFSTD
jgi:hypothetical protein